MFKSFCSRQQRGEFELSGRDELWRLLVTITLRKARNAANAHRRKSATWPGSLRAPAGDRSAPAHWIFEEMDAAAPTPEEAMVLNEALEPRLQALENPELRQISLWRLEGYTNREIAERLKCTERAIERKLGRIRSLWTSYDDSVR